GAARPGLHPVRLGGRRPPGAGRSRAPPAVRRLHALLLLRGALHRPDRHPGGAAPGDTRLVDHPRRQPPGVLRDARLLLSRAPGDVAGVPGGAPLKTPPDSTLGTPRLASRLVPGPHRVPPARTPVSRAPVRRAAKPKEMTPCG